MSNVNKSIDSFSDDDINLMPYIIHIIENWRLFVVGVAVSTIIGFFLFLLTPKQYFAQTTYIMPVSNTTVASSGLFSALGFSSESLSSQTGIYSQYIQPIFKSYRIKVYVANHLIKNQKVDELIREIPEADQVNHVIGGLNFSKNVKLRTIDGVETISFQHTEQKYILPVLETYLMALINLNDELNIDSDKLEIIPLDKAVFPISPFAPNLHKLIILINGIVFIIIFIMVLAVRITRDFKHKNNISL